MQHADVSCETTPLIRARRDIFGSNFGGIFTNDFDPFPSNNYYQPTLTSQTFERRCVNGICEECVSGQCGQSRISQAAQVFGTERQDFGRAPFWQSNLGFWRCKSY